MAGRREFRLPPRWRVSILPFPMFLSPVRIVFSAILLCPLAHAQSALPPDPVRLDNLSAFRPVTANWKLASDLAGDPRQDKILSVADGTGILVCNPTKEARGHLFTVWEHGD